MVSMTRISRHRRAKNEYRSYITDSIRNAADAYDMYHHELWRFGIIQHSERWARP